MLALANKCYHMGDNTRTFSRQRVKKCQMVVWVLNVGIYGVLKTYLFLITIETLNFDKNKPVIKVCGEMH